MATASAFDLETRWSDSDDSHASRCSLQRSRRTRRRSPTLAARRHASDPDLKPPRKPIRNFDYKSDTESDDSSSDSTSSFDSDTSLANLDAVSFDYDGAAILDRRRRRREGNLIGEDDAPKTVEVPPFPVGERIYFKEDCIVCLIESTHPKLHLNTPSMVKPRFRACCSKFVCSPCLEEYCSVKVNIGIVHIGCPNLGCTSYLHRDEIAFHLKTEPLKEKFYKFLIDANKDPLTKTCPRCCHVTRVKPSELRSRKNRHGVKKTCPECELVWCFPCQAPWHENMSCRQYCAGDKLVSEWAKEVHYGSRNAQKCPKCMVYIERTEGCDHMSCGYCQTDFCYRCGGRYRSLRFLGSHHSRYSVFGCKYYLKPNKPAQRIFIRSSVLGGKILAVPALLTVGVALLPFALMAGAVVAPVYGGITLHRYLKKRRLHKPKRTRPWRPRVERPPVVLLSVYMREGVAIPPCELTSHFESELDSTQMNEIRADLDDLHLQSLMRLPASEPARNNESFPPFEIETIDTKPRRRRRYENSNGRERVRGSRLGKRRCKLPSKFDIPDPENPNTDVFGLVDLFDEVKPFVVERADDGGAAETKDGDSLTEEKTSLTKVDVHSDVGETTGEKDASVGEVDDARENDVAVGTVRPRRPDVGRDSTTDDDDDDVTKSPYDVPGSCKSSCSNIAEITNMTERISVETTM